MNYFELFEAIVIAIVIALLGWKIARLVISSFAEDEPPRFWRLIPQTLIPLPPEGQSNHLIQLSGKVKAPQALEGSRGSLHVTVLKWVKGKNGPYLRSFKVSKGCRYRVKGGWVYFDIKVSGYTMSTHVYFPVPTVGEIEFDKS